MKGFLKYVLLAIVRFVVGLCITLLLTGVAYILSAFAIGRFMLSFINDGYISEVITLWAQLGAYWACVLVANKISAYKPFRVLCAIGSIGAVYGIISSLRYNEPIIPFCINLVVTIIFFVNAKDWIDQ